MNIFTSFFASMIAVGITAYLLPGVTLTGLGAVALVVIVLGFMNAVVKPILSLLTFPITLVTLGLFSLVVNAAIVLLVDLLVSGFEVAGFLDAFLFSIVMSVVNTVVGWVIK